MNDNVITTAGRSLYGDLFGMLRSAWRRSAEQAGREARAAARPAPQRSEVLALGAMLGAAALLTAFVVIVALSLSLARSAAVAAVPTHAQQPDAGTAQQRYLDATQAFRARRFASAYGGFAQLADEGHAPSALMALVMVCNGASAFGTEWSATPGQLQRWSAMAARDVHERGVLIAEHDRGE